MLPGDFTAHPCPEYFSLDLATTFILQEAQMSENYRAPGLGNANTEVVQEKRMECKKREGEES
jgi:hypothetical protein